MCRALLKCLQVCCSNISPRVVQYLKCVCVCVCLFQYLTKPSQDLGKKLVDQTFPKWLQVTFNPWPIIQKRSKVVRNVIICSLNNLWDVLSSHHTCFVYLCVWFFEDKSVTSLVHTPPACGLWGRWGRGGGRMAYMLRYTSSGREISESFKNTINHVSMLASRFKQFPNTRAKCGQMFKSISKHARRFDETLKDLLNCSGYVAIRYHMCCALSNWYDRGFRHCSY